MTTPTQRTLKALKDMGRKCGMVEKFNPHVGPHGIRQDLFGIIDIIALDKDLGCIGVQSCGQSFSEHLRKLTIEKYQDSHDWLSTPGCHLELWGWRKLKVKRGGKAMRWTPRIKVITLEDLMEDFLQ